MIRNLLKKIIYKENNEQKPIKNLQLQVNG